MGNGGSKTRERKVGKVGPDLPIGDYVTFRNDSVEIEGLNFLKTKYYDRLLVNAKGFDGFFPRFTLPKT